jgi:hypothetical protein
MPTAFLSYPSKNISEQKKILITPKAISISQTLKDLKATLKKIESKSAGISRDKYLRWKTIPTKQWFSLPMPNSFNVNLSHTWEESNTLLITGGILNSLVSAGMKELFKKSTDKIAGILGGTSSYTAKVSHYEDTAPLVFDFSWKFTPKNKEESMVLYKIIKILQLASMPKGLNSIKDFKLSYVKPPAVFDIKFIGNTKDILTKDYYFKNNRINDMVITSINTNYTPEGEFYPFSDGTPTTIDLNISFKESRNVVDWKQIFGEPTFYSLLSRQLEA